MFESEESCTHVMHIVFGKKCVLICIKKTQHYYVVLDKSRWNMNQTSSISLHAFWVIPLLSCFSRSLGYCCFTAKQQGHQSA